VNVSDGTSNIIAATAKNATANSLDAERVTAIVKYQSLALQA